MHLLENSGMELNHRFIRTECPFVNILPLLFIGKRTIIINKRIEKTFRRKHFIVKCLSSHHIPTGQIDFFLLSNYIYITE